MHRGDGEEIDAAILFTDLIGFATLSNTRTGPEIVSVLNEAFDIMVPPVEARGGEILKFLGDGFFAIFPYGEKTTLVRRRGKPPAKPFWKARKNSPRPRSAISSASARRSMRGGSCTAT